MNILLNLLIIFSSMLDQALPLFLFWLVIRPAPNLVSKKSCILTALIYAVICIVLNFVPVHYFIKTCIMIVLKMVYCWRISDHRIGVSLFLPLLDLASTYACESTVPFVLALFFPAIPFSSVVGSSFLMIFGILQSRSLLYLLWGTCILLLYRQQKYIHPSHIRASQWVTLCSAIALMSSFIVAFQQVANTRPQEIASILGALPLIFLILVSLFFLLAISLSRETERTYLLQGELLHAEQQLEQQKAISSMYEQMRGMQHDFRNHMQIIRSLAEQQHDQGIVAYVKDVTEQVLVGKSLIHTGVLPIDSLLNSKLIHAEKLGIEMSAEVCFPEPCEIPISDLCTALFNLLDNAIEACEKNQNQESHWIHLTLYQHESFLVICCTNPSEAKPISHKSLFRTTKKGSLHGIGMRQLQRISEQHHGFFHAEYTDGVFTAKLALPHHKFVKKVHASYAKTERQVAG